MMKLAASQMGWSPEEMIPAIQILKNAGFSALEILPTMAVGESPYTKIEQGKAFQKQLQKEYGFSICSMQSLWYGKNGSIFAEGRKELLEYTKEAILFAEQLGIPNLVFGCPKNRILPENLQDDLAIDFFKQVGDFAYEHGTVFALEANPIIYGTNYMNTTKQALDVAKRVASKGCKVNLDFGTILENKESILALKNDIGYIHHVHISEPYLAMIEKHQAHIVLASLLQEEGYEGYVSIEMKKQPLENLQLAAAYIAEVFE